MLMICSREIVVSFPAYFIFFLLFFLKLSRENEKEKNIEKIKMLNLL